MSENMQASPPHDRPVDTAGEAARKAGATRRQQSTVRHFAHAGDRSPHAANGMVWIPARKPLLPKQCLGGEHQRHHAPVSFELPSLARRKAGLSIGVFA